jgi:hypothetical protein
MTIILALLLAVPVAAADLPQITIEAESYTEVTGGSVRVLDRAEASGGQCVSYWEEPGVAVTCEFEVPEAGEYCLTLGYALNWPDTRREVRIDGEPVPGLEDVVLPTTGSWADFSAVTLQGRDGGRARIPLEPGPHTLTLANVESRGLAWDYAVFHGPEDLLADVPLGEGEMPAFVETLPATMRGPLARGTSAGHHTEFATTGWRNYHGWRVGDLLGAFSATGPPGPHGPGWSEAEEADLGGLRIVHMAGRGGVPGATGASLFVKGDRAVYVIGASLDGPEEPASMPAPIIEWRDGTPWHLAPRTVAERLDGVAEGMIGSVEISSIAAMHVIVPEGAGRQAMECERVDAGQFSVFGYRVGPALRPADSSIAATIDGEDVVIRSSAEIPPALARFYGIAQFEVRVRPDASMTITTEAGETLQLPAP